MEFLGFLFCKLGHEGPAVFGLLRELTGPEREVLRVEPAVYWLLGMKPELTLVIGDSAVPSVPLS